MRLVFWFFSKDEEKFGIERANLIIKQSQVQNRHLRSMSRAILLLLLSSIFVCSSSSQDESFTSVLISEEGLNFIKNLLVHKAVSSMIPLKLPQIQESLRIPFLGNVDMVLSNATLYDIDVLSSYVKPGNSGIAIVVSGSTANFSMNWHYSYGSWLLPIEISDGGRASIQVDGMEVGLTLRLENHNGTLKLSLLDCGCHLRDIMIKLDGGASWLYQGMIDAFDDQIGSAVESAVVKKLKEGILKLDSFLQDLPKEIPVDNTASLNVTFVGDPLLSSSSIEFDIDGLFTAKKPVSVNKLYSKSQGSSAVCANQSKMLGISLDEAVFNSASALYYNAEFMQWIVDKVPEQSLLNTAGWRFIIPQLYKKFPNDDMNLNISLSSPPVIRISEKNVDATVYADVVIDVLEAGQVIPVACISMEIRGSGSVKISGNNLGGSVKLNDFTMSLKWSQIGNLRMYLVQPVMWTIIQTVVVPFANSHLEKGFPLPIIHGFTLQNAETVFSASGLAVCGDVSYSEAQNFSQLSLQFA